MYRDKRISATMRERARLGFAFNVKGLDAAGRFAGYASVFGVVDNQRDVVTRGAFSQTVKGRAHEIKLLWQHQQEEPIGVFDQMFEDSRGLYVEGRLLLGVKRAQEAYTLLKAGALSGLSIGYSPRRYTMDTKNGIRRLHEVELWEVSLVTFPANEAANVTVVKQATPASYHDEKFTPMQLIELAGALDGAVKTLRCHPERM